MTKLNLKQGQRVLCVGVGTGNEIARMSRMCQGISVAGVDLSLSALQKARGKAGKLRELPALERMDAQQLAFQDEAFNAVLCLHVMGFVADDSKATGEIMRVLRKGGQFVITYPSGNGLWRLFKESCQGIWQKLRTGRPGQAAADAAALVGGGVINIPLSWLVKPGVGFYSRAQIERIFASQNMSFWHMEEDPVYQEFVVWGTK